MRKGGAVGVVLASVFALGAGLGGTARAGSSGAAGPSQPRVLSLGLTGVVDPFEANYLAGGIDRAARDGDAAVLLTIDTPGGLDSSMRKIIQSILNSDVPVICYTAPSGARAASAGTFIMLACPMNAMAPGTNIGAAHPVGVSGAIESEKVTNDAAAFIRSLAERWGRNADWAERAVRESVSISAQQARAINVVDFVVGDVRALLDAAGGCGGGATSPDRPTVPNVCGATLEPVSMGLGARILHRLIDPNLAFLFFYLGLGLIVIELLHPGISVPGIFGTVFLIAAFVDFGFLPVQVAGVVLLIASAVFFLLELKHPGIGLPTLGGVVTLVFGGLLLFNSSVPNARVSPWLIGTVAVLVGLFFGFVVSAVVRTRHLPRPVGPEDLRGEEGVAIDDLAPSGRVRARRENWTAETTGPPIAKGTGVRVVSMKGLRLVVEPVGSPPPGVAPPAEAMASSKGEGGPAGPTGETGQGGNP